MKDYERRNMMRLLWFVVWVSVMVVAFKLGASAP